MGKARSYHLGTAASAWLLLAENINDTQQLTCWKTGNPCLQAMVGTMFVTNCLVSSFSYNNCVLKVLAKLQTSIPTPRCYEGTPDRTNSIQLLVMLEKCVATQTLRPQAFCQREISRQTRRRGGKWKGQAACSNDVTINERLAYGRTLLSSQSSHKCSVNKQMAKKGGTSENVSQRLGSTHEDQKPFIFRTHHSLAD